MNSYISLATKFVASLLAAGHIAFSFFGHLPSKISPPIQKPLTEKEISHGEVLAALTFSYDNAFFNIPVEFKEAITGDADLTISGASLFKKNITAPNIIYGLLAGQGISVASGQTPRITNTGVLTLGGQSGSIDLSAGSGITISGLSISNSGVTSLQGSSGALSLTAGGGISISGLTLSNSDLGSSQNIFKTFAVSGQSNIVASSNTDSITFAGGTGVTLTTDSTNKKLTITANSSSLNVSGWTDDGTVVRLTNITESVGIGTTSPTSKLHVTGAVTGKALSIFDETGDQAPLTASESGKPVFTVAHPTGTIVNGLTLTPSISGSGIAEAATGTDTNIAYSIDAKGAGALNLNNTATGDVLIAGGSGSTGCTVTNSNGNLACTGSITGSSSGTQGYWSRSGTTLSPSTAGDAITTSGNISTSGTGTITSAGNLTASNGLTLTTGALSLTSTSGTAALTLTSSTTAFNVQSGLFDIDTTNSKVGIGTTSPLEKLDINGNATASGNLTLAGGARTIAGQAGNSLTIGDSNTGNLLLSPGSNSVVLGSGENGTPVATTLRGAAAAGTNTAGAKLTFDASNGTGTGGSGDITFRVAPSRLNNAITHDFSTNSNTGSPNNTTLSFSHTVGAHPDRILVVGVSLKNGTSQIVSTVTYSGIPLILLSTSTNGTTVRSEMWYLTAPPIGTNTITVTISAPATKFVAGSSSYYNVNQTTSFGTAATNTGTTTTATVDVTSATGELVIDTVAKNNSTETIAQGGSQTNRWNDATTNGTASTNVRGGGSTQPGAVTTTMSWTWATTAREWAIIGAPLKPVGSASSSTADTLSDTLYISNGQRIGIGTTSPLEKLDVSGNILLQGGGYIDTSTGGTLGIGQGQQTGLTLGRSGQSTTLNGNVQAFTLVGNVTGQGVNMTGINGVTSVTNIPLALNGGGSGDITMETAANSGNVGIGTLSPTSKLHVTGAVKGKALSIFDETGDQDMLTASASGTTRFRIKHNGGILADLPGTGTGFALCHTTQTGTTQEEIVDCTSAPTADYMEMYPVDKSIKTGDVVATGNSYATTKDGDRLSVLVRSKASYQKNTIGIVSDPTKAGDFNSIGHNIKQEDNPMPIALSGRVFVKVSSFSKSILAGDYLTSSDDEGKAIKAEKAGFTIGKALEDWTPDSGKDKIIVFVNLGYADPQDILASLKLGADGSVILSKTTSVESAPQNKQQQISQQININDLVKRVSDLESSSSSSSADVKTRLDQLSKDLNFLNGQVLGASVSATLQKPQSILSSDTQTATISALTVTGNTNLYDLGVVGNFNVGTININGLSGSLNSIGQDLKIQSDKIAGISFEGGTVILDAGGNISLKEGRIIGNDNIRGISAPVGKGQAQIQITFKSSRPNSSYAVSVSPSWLTQFAIKNKTANGFTVAFSPEPSIDSTLDWLVID